MHVLARKTQRRAFTLIEILIVLAIIGILGAILLPVFNGARESARTATCSSNLKQIYMGTQLYLQDSNGTYPNLSYSASNCDWASRVYPYVKSTAVFQCPNAEHGEFKPECPPSSADGKDKWDGSYEYNLLRAGTRQFIREAHVGRPSEVSLFVDGTGSYFTPYGNGVSTGPAGTLNAYQGWVVSAQDLAEGSRGHRGGLNICFADGHIKWVGADAMDKRSLWLNDRDAEYSGSPTPSPTP